MLLYAGKCQVLLMSEKSQCSDLRGQIWLLDQQFEPRELKPANWTSAAERLRKQEAPYLREVYRIGRPALRPPPKHWEVPQQREQLEIPREILLELEVRPRDAAAACVRIPDELLWPKRKRGRPRNKTLHTLAKSQRCSERHARRLLASGEQRKRVRRSLGPDEHWALQQREKRAALLQALKQEEALDRLSRILTVLNCWDAYEKAYKERDSEGVVMLLSSEVGASVRQFVKRMLDEKGVVEATVICGFALPGIGLRLASIHLGLSRNTIYRRFRGRLQSLRTQGEILRTTALPDAGSQIVEITKETENAWAQQTNRSAALHNRKHFSPENFRAIH